MDLSAPVGHSVSDGISRELWSLHYASLDNTAARVIDFGQGMLLAKMDIRQPYQNVSVAPKDKPLLA